MIELEQAKIADLTDSVGASKILACSVEMIRQYVKKNRMRCFQFEEGELVEREPGALTRGKDLLFLRQDLHAFERKPVGRPRAEGEG